MQHFIVVLFLVFSIFVYLLLPQDWMKEFRFATPFFPFFYTYLFILSENVIEKLNWPNLHKSLVAAILAAVFIGPSIIDFINRSYQFKSNPTVPFLMVADKYANTFDNYASLLNVKNGSFLLPDAGGTLYYSGLKIYDLSGLTDKTIARTLVKKPKDFYDYVFKITKPTFIHTHGVWAYRAKLDSDKRFREDYLPLKESIEPRMVKKFNGLKIYSGDYVRKDILNSNLGIIQQIVELTNNQNKLPY